MFEYRIYQGCPTALLSLTEQWKEDLDKHNWHDNHWFERGFWLFITRSYLGEPKSFGLSDHALSPLRSYLSSRYQRVIKA